MSLKKINVSWEQIGKAILTLAGVVPILVLLVNFLASRSPQITVKNELVFPIKVYAGDDYQGLIQGNSKRTFKFYSEKVFPLKIKWEGVHQKAENSDAIGDFVTGSIDLVDNHQSVVIGHTTGKNDYFMPVLNNETDLTCKIFVNEGLPSEKYSGVLLPHKSGINIGYYKWFVNSNVALYCDDGWHWWGIRRGSPGPALKVKSPNGLADLTLTP